jgi:CO/xanthine dehydrogenase Mo-binding subunit
MQTVAGVFRSPDAALQAAGELLRAGFLRDQLSVLLPGASERQIHSAPTSDTEQPGMGGALGGVLGAALGAASGFEIGVWGTALIPGVGPILAAGAAAAALLGAGGLIAGAKLGSLGDRKATGGIPADEVFFYEDALRQGRSVVILLAEDPHQARRAYDALRRVGAESIDAARQAWWIGLRDAESEHYRALGHNFEQDQEVYRTGFEAALRRECRGQTIEDAADCLKWWHPQTWDSEAFRRGFERGRRYLESIERRELVGRA